MSGMRTRFKNDVGEEIVASTPGTPMLSPRAMAGLRALLATGGKTDPSSSWPAICVGFDAYGEISGRSIARDARTMLS